MDYEAQCLTIMVGDAMRMLTWILARNGKPAHINDVPVNFNSNHWMIHYPGGALYEAQDISPYRFTFTVTDAGMRFLRQHGWTGDAKNPPLNPTQAMPVEEKKVFKSVWNLDRNRRIHEFKDLTKVPAYILEMLKDNNVAVIDGRLYAVSFEDLMGHEDDPTLSVQ